MGSKFGRKSRGVECLKLPAVLNHIATGLLRILRPGSFGRMRSLSIEFPYQSRAPEFHSDCLIESVLKIA